MSIIDRLVVMAAVTAAQATLIFMMVLYPARYPALLVLWIVLAAAFWYNLYKAYQND